MSRSFYVVWPLLLLVLLFGCAKLPGDLGVLPAQAIPSAPVMSNIASGNGSAMVKWDRVSGATSYNLYYKTGSSVDKASGTRKVDVSSGSTVTGLTNGTQYAFAVSAVNGAGESGLSNVQTAIPQAGSGIVTDIDGNVYDTVTIGTQVWMKENLKTTKYNDGTAIPLVTDLATWAALTTPGYCWFNNDSATYKSTNYGALYNWYAVNTGKLAPAGWHVATDSEWTILTTYLGGVTVAGGPLKETGTTHWTSPNTGATNSSGFSALPGGHRHISVGFINFGTDGMWWSATAGNPNPWAFHVFYNNVTVKRANDANNNYGFSVRCVKDGTNGTIPSAPAITSVTPGDGSVTIYWDTVSGATSYNLYYKAGTLVDKVTGTLKASVSSGYAMTGLTNGTQYAFAVSAVAAAGGESGLSVVKTATPQAGSGTVTDADGNVYHTVTIGTQVWMVENLKTTKYNDGTAIPLVTVNAAWAALTTGGYCWYNNDSVTNRNPYGALYNWYAVNTGKLAPAGWHVPTDSEWSVLIKTFIGDTTTAGGKLKEAGTAHWASPNAGASNSIGFSALPGGARYDPYGEFTELGTDGWWWSSTAFDAAYSWERYMNYQGAYAGRSYAYKYYGFSVRCVKD